MDIYTPLQVMDIYTPLQVMDIYTPLQVQVMDIYTPLQVMNKRVLLRGFNGSGGQVLLYFFLFPSY